MPAPPSLVRAVQPGGFARWVGAEVLALVAPPRCAACGEALGAAAERLCGDCRAELPWLRGARCPRCALPAFARAWAPVAHAGPARALVAQLKFQGVLAAADLMAAQIAAGAPAALLDDATLVPVPTHPARRRARGFDPAERLAGALARRAGRPLSRCLRRRGPPARQVGAPRALRRAPGRVEVVARAPAPLRVALVDDVHTTGATLDACARALRRAGAAEVVALTYARALRRAGQGLAG